MIDFGLAKATSGMQLSEHSLFTAFGSVTGTPLYMAPEQANFSALDVDTRADIYALGVILYELLTGSTPIRRETFQRAALDEMLRVIREDEPPTPSSRISSSDTLPSVAAKRHVELARLSRLVKGDLDWIVMKALAKERERRYDSAIGLANDVERFINHEPVVAGPPAAAYRLRKFVRRNRGRVVAASLVLLAMVGGIVGTTFGLVEATKQRRQAEKRLTQAEKANAILGSVFEDLDWKQSEVDGKPLLVVLGEHLDRATAELEGEATGDALSVARTQATLGRSQFALGYYAKSLALLTKAEKTFAERLGPDSPEAIQAGYRIARALRESGERQWHRVPPGIAPPPGGGRAGQGPPRCHPDPGQPGPVLLGAGPIPSEHPRRVRRDHASHPRAEGEGERDAGGDPPAQEANLRPGRRRDAPDPDDPWIPAQHRRRVRSRSLAPGRGLRAVEGEARPRSYQDAYHRGAPG